MNLLGRLLLMTIREDISVPLDEFREVWLSHYLPTNILPRPRTTKDAFRRATPKRVWKNGIALMEYKGDQKINGSEMECVLVFSQDDTEKVDIHHLNRAIVYLVEDRVEVEYLTPLMPKEQEYIEEIQANYVKARTHIDGSQVRTALQKVLHMANALVYRDGCYLVPANKFAYADAIGGIIRQLENYSRRECVLWDIPYVSTRETKSQVMDALSDHIHRVSATVVHDARNINPKSRSRPQTLRGMLDDLERVVSNYGTLLGEDMSRQRAQVIFARAELDREL